MADLMIICRTHFIVFASFLSILLLTLYFSAYNNHQTPNSTLSRAPNTREKLTGAEKIEDELSRARDAIRMAIQTRNYTSNKVEDFIPSGTVYRNSYAFHQ
ncbi:hypothetical protein C5167_030430 [Papaver somniferum]|uniref:probable glycosyltransferase At3g42180 n=1 Tax=Papaver somniferum TaxID=3469 RepID=UPI000E7050C8|nr:probable glycosyltransferase At3g42180 [Papaver somniferum]RZC90356.1 hypothetical protein C5167_030430 [Papaver somniferum]